MRKGTILGEGSLFHGQGPAGYTTMPPLTPSTCPVMNSCSSRKAAAWAVSSGVPVRPRGVSSRRAAKSAYVRSPFMGVSITPGDRQFTRMPEGPSSLARALVRPMTPALAAE